MRFATAILALAVASVSAAPTVEKRWNTATTNPPAAPGVTHCDLAIGEHYFIHVGEPFNGGSGCNDIYTALVGENDSDNWWGIIEFECTADGPPQSEGWQPTYLEFNAVAGYGANIGDALGEVFNLPFWCAY